MSKKNIMRLLQEIANAERVVEVSMYLKNVKDTNNARPRFGCCVTFDNQHFRCLYGERVENIIRTLHRKICDVKPNGLQDILKSWEYR